MVRWLLVALAIAVAGCGPSAADVLPVPTANPTRPTLSLPTHVAAETSLPHIPSSWEITPSPRTPFALLGTRTAGRMTPSAPAESPTLPSSTATRTPSPTPTPHTHRFVVSTRARSSYYCDTDSAWKSLSAANLRWYDDERSLKADYPRLTLHAPCE